MAHRQGLDVPADLSVCGFDDTLVAQSVWPELTTIRQPVGEMAAQALVLLVEAIRSYTRAFPPGVPGVPSAEGVKSILENELRIPLKLDKPLAAENFFDLRWAEEVRKELSAKGTTP